MRTSSSSSSKIRNHNNNATNRNSLCWFSSHIRGDSSSDDPDSGRNKNNIKNTGTSTRYYDVTIVGGGAVGATLASNIQRKLPGMKVALLEARDKIPTFDFNSSQSTTTSTTDNDEQKQQPRQQPPNPRSYALSPKSLSILGPTVKSKLHPYLGYYDSMQVWQANSPATLTFTSNDIVQEQEQQQEEVDNTYLGACCEDLPLVAALWEDFTTNNGSSSSDNPTNVDCYTNITNLSNVRSGDVGSLATLTTPDGTTTIQTAVLVGADGGNSSIRKTSGISRVGLEYEQHALTFTVELEDKTTKTTKTTTHPNNNNNPGPMGRRAFQRYLSDGGPMALLPTYSPNHAVVVWSTSPENVARWKDAPNDELVAYLNSSSCLSDGLQRVPPLFEGIMMENGRGPFGEGNILSNLAYGADRVLDTIHYGLAMASQHPDPSFRVPPKVSNIVSPKFTFPLSCFQATSYVKDRVVLVGDAGHIVHPMAGQGLNLGLGDVDVLVNKLEKAYNAGMDLSTFLNEYNTERQRTVSISLGGIHALQRIFRYQNVPIQHVKTFGMNAIQNIGPMRRQLAVAAAHGVAL